jgi:hypothetical protein
VTKADQIRVALAGGVALQFEALQAAVGFHIEGHLAPFIKRREILTEGEPGDFNYRINPQFIGRNVGHPVIRGRAAQQLGIDDTVRTPSGREARIAGQFDDRLQCIYLDDGDEVLLRTSLLTLVCKGAAT